ncbi:MAG: SUMF1/EgtB/PvdO family nonheme iron enzyme [Bacteroidia bacterium]
MKQLLLLLFTTIALSLSANNIQITNVSLASQDAVRNFYMVEFDLSWENSWRTSTYESNWDAAWVFVKVTLKDQADWQHASLHYINGTSDGHTMPAGATYRTANNSYGTASEGKGLFIYRDADGFGNVDFKGIQVRWDYGADGFRDSDVLEISVHGIEMVYVPQGAFYVGDGADDFGQFEAGNSGNPFRITSEGALTLGGTNVNNLSNNDAINMLNADDFDYGTTRSLPAAFPKGYDAFYCMKYETSQAQYASFLSKLTQVQKNDRDGPHYVNAINVFPIRDGEGYAIADNPERAMDYLSWADMVAYLDWAALRPMSELEYEKACRGLREPVLEEYAWGNHSWYLEGLYSISNPGLSFERIIGGIGEGVGNANSTSIYQGASHPLRCGIFAASSQNHTRQETGATYWGIMEMTGNTYEPVISIGNSQSRDFSGLHGDGTITGTGNASFTLLANWAFVNAVGVGQRNSEVSQRYLVNTNNPDREKWYGLRGVRSAN